MTEKTALIVGGDRIGSYSDYLVGRGFGPVLHWQGRKNSACHRAIPSRTRLIVVMVDQISHGLANKIRRAADELGLPVVFTQRSISQLDRALARLTTPLTPSRVH